MYAFESDSAVGMPAISPVIGSSDRPSGSVTPSSKKNSVIRFSYTGLLEVPSTPITNTMFDASYDRFVGSLYSHLSVFTSPSTPS